MKKNNDEYLEGSECNDPIGFLVSDTVMGNCQFEHHRFNEKMMAAQTHIQPA